MFMRVDKLQAELPVPKKADPNAAAALLLRPSYRTAMTCAKKERPG